MGCWAAFHFSSFFIFIEPKPSLDALTSHITLHSQGSVGFGQLVKHINAQNLPRIVSSSQSKQLATAQCNNLSNMQWKKVKAVCVIYGKLLEVTDWGILCMLS